MLSKWGLKVKRNRDVGKAGENIAVDYLQSLGFRVEERNFRTRWGEIDVVARKGKEYYFVEVKTRNNGQYGLSIEALPFYRVERLKKMALMYASRHKIEDRALHLSLLGIDGPSLQPKITFLPDIVG